MKKFIPLLCFLTMFFMTSCSGETNAPQEVDAVDSVPTEYAGLTNPLGADAANEGAKNFHVYCESCHGPKGKGDGYAGQSLEPKPKDLSQLQTVAADDYLFWRISEGKPGTAMVAWQGILDDEQIWQVIAFIRTLKP